MQGSVAIKLCIIEIQDLPSYRTGGQIGFEFVTGQRAKYFFCTRLNLTIPHTIVLSDESNQDPIAHQHTMQTSCL